MKRVGVGLVGFGTVGQGVVRLLRDEAEGIRTRAGVTLELRRVVDVDTRRARAVSLPPRMLTDDLAGCLADPEVLVVVVAVGGPDNARGAILPALEAGKSVVTADKAAIAAHGAFLADVARRRGVSLGIEATVGAAVPVIRVLRASVLADTVDGVAGVVNGTTNFVLTRMTEEGDSLEEALAEARARGFAEADPTDDLDGWDSVRKLAIVAGLAFGAGTRVEEIPRAGIRAVRPEHCRAARALGYAVRLVAWGRRDSRGGPPVLRVEPTLVPAADPLAAVRNEENAIRVTCRAAGDLTLAGRGAGAMPTAHALLSDALDAATGRGSVPGLPLPPPGRSAAGDDSVPAGRLVLAPEGSGLARKLEAAGLEVLVEDADAAGAGGLEAAITAPASTSLARRATGALAAAVVYPILPAAAGGPSAPAPAQVEA
ncbi:MAG: homoserine dehydrogenase [Planctomycetales bacterium]|nr:homoserine dehydrogenase [Planctomycetales bacterium]